MLYKIFRKGSLLMFSIVTEITSGNNQTVQMNEQGLIRACKYFDDEEK